MCKPPPSAQLVIKNGLCLEDFGQVFPLEFPLILYYFSILKKEEHIGEEGAIIWM